MRKQMLPICLATLLLLSACEQQAVSPAEPDYVTATLFCDIAHWKIPDWSVEEGSITGTITEKTGLALDIITPSQEADTQLKIMLVDDELPDIISLTDATTISQLVTSGKVWRLDELLSTYLPSSHLLSAFPEDIKRELIKRDGAWYSLPSHLNSADAREQWKSSEYTENMIRYNDNNAIMWNLALLDRLDLTVDELQTEEQVLAACEAAKDLETDAGPVIPALVDGKMYLDPTMKFLLGSFGAEWVDEDGHYKDIYLQPEARDALRFLNTLMRNGCVTPDQLVMEITDTQRLLSSGRVLCFIGNAANTGVDYNEWISSGPILSSGGAMPVLGKNLRASTGWCQTFVSKSCENPTQVAAFLDYMTSEEGMTLWVYGVEGVHFTMGEDGSYIRTEAWQNAHIDYQQTGLGAWWMFANSAWERSVLPPPDEAQRHEDGIYTAYGRSEHTRIYDVSLLTMPTGLIPLESEEGRIQQAVERWKQEQVTQIVLAEDTTEFQRCYDQFIQGLYDLEIERLDAKLDEGYQANCREYGDSISKVNHGEGTIGP